MATTSLVIREISPEEFDLVWPIVREVIGAGDTYALGPEASFDDARQMWTTPPARAFAAFEGDEVVGTSMLQPAQPGLGDHVANAGYMVAPAHRRKGIARRLCQHSLDTARGAGFQAMVFGCLPRAYRHARLGLTDTLVMHRFL